METQEQLASIYDVKYHIVKCLTEEDDGSMEYDIDSSEIEPEEEWWMPDSWEE